MIERRASSQEWCELEPLLYLPGAHAAVERYQGSVQAELERITIGVVDGPSMTGGEERQWTAPELAEFRDFEESVRRAGLHEERATLGLTRVKRAISAQCPLPVLLEAEECAAVITLGLDFERALVAAESEALHRVVNPDSRPAPAEAEGALADPPRQILRVTNGRLLDYWPGETLPERPAEPVHGRMTFAVQPNRPVRRVGKLVLEQEPTADTTTASPAAAAPVGHPSSTKDVLGGKRKANPKGTTKRTKT